MKMKKILSLLLAACTLASFATVASAAEEPTMKLVAEKISFDGEYAEYAGDYDWSEYNSDAVGGSYDTYSLKVIATGIEVKTEAVKSGKSTIYVGDSITGYQVKIGVSTDAEYDMDWKWGLIKQIATPTGAPGETGAAMVSTGTNALEPAAKVAKTIGKDDETVILELLVTVDSGKAVNFSFDDYALFLATYPDTSKTPSASYAFNASNGTMVTSTPTLTLPVVDTPVEPDPEPPVEPEETAIEVVAGPMDLDTTEGKGIAWDVTITKFDSAKKYEAKFTDADTGAVRADEGFTYIDVSDYAEAQDSNVSFAIILKLTADRNVNLDVQIAE